MPLKSAAASKVQRPRAAFCTVCMDLKNIETDRLKRLLRDVVTINTDPAGRFELDRHHISNGLTSLKLIEP